MPSEDAWAELVAHGLPRRLIQGWRRRGLERLLPLQRRALRTRALLSGGSLLVLAPTSAGKSFVGEVALARALGMGARALLLVPTKALAEERLAWLEPWAAAGGWRALCATRDRPESDAAVRRGRFHLLIAVYEKAHHYLVTLPGFLAGVGTVVVDELQMLADPERGPLLDRLLTRLAVEPYTLQRVGLGPPLPEAGALARWFDAELLLDRIRPVELREGVLESWSGRFRFGGSRMEALLDPQELRRLSTGLGEAGLARPCEAQAARPTLLAAAAALARRGEPTLLFAATRADCVRGAEGLAGLGVGVGPARSALPALSRAEPGRLNDRLGVCLEAGVAFHNADLPAELRTLVESAFAEGEVRLLVTTSTLGLGVNLAARNVLHDPWRVETDPASGRIVRLPLTRQRFSYQGGRAGRTRPGTPAPPGRSILVATSPEERERLWAELIEATEPPLRPTTSIEPATEALEFLSPGRGRTAAHVRRSLARTFRATFAPANGAPALEAVQAALSALEAEGWVRRDAISGGWEATAIGKTVAGLGLGTATARAMLQWIEAGLLPEDDPAERAITGLFIRLARTDDGRRAAAPLLGSIGRSVDCENDPPMEPWVDPNSGMGEGLDAADPPRTSAGRASIALTSLLGDWLGGTPTLTLEERYGVYGGALARVASEFARLLGALAELTRARGGPPRTVRALARLAEATRVGVPLAGLALSCLAPGRLRRTTLLRLLAAGYDTPQALLELPPEELALLAGDDAAAEWIEAARRQRRVGHVVGREAAAEAPPRPGRRAERQADAVALPKASWPLLRVDLRSPGVIRAAGQEVVLPPRSYDLLAALAESPRRVLTRAFLHARLWPEGGAEDQQLDAHRRRLIARLRPALGPRAARVAELVRGVGFRLNLPESAVLVNR